MATAKKLTPFEEVNLFFDQAAERLGLAEGRREMLRRPWRELQVQVPVRMDDGHINVYNGFRSSTTVLVDRTKAAYGTILKRTKMRSEH